VSFDKEKHVHIKFLRRFCKALLLYVRQSKELETGASSGDFLKLTQETMRSFVFNDCIARWQHLQYLAQIITGLHCCGTLWVIDFILNYQVFSKVEIQQDFYNQIYMVISTDLNSVLCVLS